MENNISKPLGLTRQVGSVGSVSTKPTTGVSAPKLDLKAVKAKGSSDLMEFRNKTCIYLGATDDPKPYYPNKKDPITGKTLKDASGNALKETVPTGYTYILSEFGTSRQVRVVLQSLQKLEDLSFYEINGKGYKLDAFDFLIEECSVVRYEQ